MSNNELKVTLTASNDELLRALDQASQDIAAASDNWSSDFRAVSNSSDKVIQSVNDLVRTAESAKGSELRVIDFSRTQTQIKATSSKVDELLGRLSRMASEGKYVPDDAIPKLMSLSNSLREAGRQTDELREKTKTTNIALNGARDFITSLVQEGLGTSAECSKQAQGHRRQC